MSGVKRGAGSRKGRRVLADVCVERVGAVRATQLTLRLIQWATVAEWVGHFPSISEFAAATMMTTRTAERYRATIRAAFSEEEFRELVEQLVQEDVAARSPRDAREVAVAV
jgi:hypothetical protein